VPGSVFLGARVDYLDGRRVAVLVYKQGQHLVDHYIWPADAADRTPQVTTVKGFRIAQWTQGGMAHRVVSDVNAAELDAIVQDCRTPAAGS
jgi:anti-sigma factor RsiW